ncbi:cingulin-like [Macadamia integrifolia]|uniref:cingulin-like n=1 Tax=Macadamia integrifolia TaxID=60698 RepID=UPI001C4E8645|nr:cingulin-like [Macadamia integrifolia]XP_042508079.1 cingulin-like [Macadamia integrifolia]
MTVETEERSGVCEVSKVEIEENLSSNLSSYEDLAKVGGEYNGIVHDGVEEIDGDVKDDGDGSYVFVDGPDAVSDELEQKDLVADPVADPAETVETVPVVEGETVFKSNDGFESGEKQLEVGELKIDNVSYDQSPIDNSCNNDGSVVSSSTNGTIVENSDSQSEESEMEKNDTNNEQNKAVVVPDVGVNQETVFTTTEIVESKLPQLDRDEVERQNGTVPLAEVESAEAEENMESITVKEAVECELQQLDNEEKVAVVDSAEKNEEQCKLDSATEVKENQLEGNKMDNNDTDDVENKVVVAPDEQGIQESIVTTTEAVEFNLPQLDHDEVEMQNGAVPSVEVESGVVEENDESIDIKEAVECKLQQLDNEEKVEEVDNVKKNEEHCKLDSATEVEESQLEGSGMEKKTIDDEQNKAVVAPDAEGNQESIFTTTEAVESKLPQPDRDEVEKQNGTVPLSEVESGEVEQNNESITVKEAVECELQQLDDEEKVEEVDSVEKNEEQCKLDSATEVKENQESEMMAKAESEAHQHHDGEEVAEEPRKLDLAKEENQESQVTDIKDIELEFGQLDNREAKDPEVTDEIPVDSLSGGIGLETTTGPVNTQLEGEALSGSIESGESLPSGPVASETEVINDLAVCGNMTCSAHFETKSENVDGSAKNPESSLDEVEQETEVRNVSVENGESLPKDPVDNTMSEAEVRNPCAEVSEILPVEGAKLETVVANGSTDVVESRPTCIAGDGKSETDIINGSVEVDMPIPSPTENLEIKLEVMNGFAETARSLPSCSVDDAEGESEVLNCPFEGEISFPVCHVADVELVSKAANGSVASGDAPPADSVNLEAIVQDGSVENGVAAAHIVNDAENEATQSTSEDTDGKPIYQGVDTEGIQGDESPQSSTKGSTADAVEEQKVDAEVVKRPFNFLIKSPRFVDDKLREQIGLAQLQVEEKTQSRDAMRATIQTTRATCNEYRDRFEAAKSEERIARDALNVKRQEIDSVQSAISIDDIDERIHNMEHMIQHETMPLKEEKQLIREIKQLKNLREQLSSHMGRQDERQQASDQRDRIEERFKLLKQELESLRKKVSQTEGITKVARAKYFDENEKLRKLQSQFKAADDLRQEAYAHLQNLRKELYEKSKHFRMYKDEQRAASDFASAGDREALQHLCVTQVDRVMELWNKNDEFRKEYIRCNTMSTLRRLRTLDGRSLGPDEEPPVIHTVVDERVQNALAASSHIDSKLVISPSEPEKLVVPPGAEKGDIKSVVKVQQENATTKLKKASKPTAMENGLATFSGREEKEEVEEENKKSKEEEELVRKAEELRREEAAARVKEQRRLEEKAKAKEAEERKKRNAEKAQARAELRAQREAELKEKEREKRAKKKEKKKVAVAEVANVGPDGESAPSTENTPSESSACEPEIKEKNMPVVKRPQKPSLLAKQTRTKPLPPPLRNKGKRRMQTWMWFLIPTLVVLALFFLGSMGVSFKFGLPSFGF